MSVAQFPYHWGLEEFLLAWEAGAFSKRAELIDGEVWDVPIGEWHAETTGTVIRRLPNGTVRVLAGSLPAGQSLPEPDCWVLRAGATPAEQLSPRMSRWNPLDVLLVVEVSDEIRTYDLGRKVAIYGDAGFTAYWSVTREGIYAHTEPVRGGYRTRVFHPAGTTLTVPYAPDVVLSVDNLLAPQGQLNRPAG